MYMYTAPYSDHPESKLRVKTQNGAMSIDNKYTYIHTYINQSISQYE